MSLFDTVTRASLPDFPFLGLNTVMDVNAMRSAATLKDVTLYTSPYLVASNKGYTKHYYAGTNLLCKPSAEPNLFELCRGAAKNVEQREKRICAKIGSGGLNASTPFISTNQLLQDKVSSLFEKCRVQMEQRTLPDIGVSCIGRANGSQEPTLQMDVDPVGKKVIAIVGFKPDYFEDAMKASLSPTGTETAQYFYHSDHLGSASWITDASGTPVQHLQYCPFGEPFVNQHTGTYQERFTFTGKERDEETGYGYFGARYMDADLLTGWLSVDPMADKYASISPYNYCAWNPVKLVDPNGMEWDSITKKEYIIPYTNEIEERIKKIEEQRTKKEDPNLYADQYDEYQNTLKELDELGNDPNNVYTVTRVHDFKDPQTYGMLEYGGTRNGKNLINISLKYIGGIFLCMGDLSHELKHASQYFNGQLGFILKNGVQVNSTNSQELEQQAFTRGNMFCGNHASNGARMKYNYNVDPTKYEFQAGSVYESIAKTSDLNPPLKEGESLLINRR